VDVETDRALGLTRDSNPIGGLDGTTAPRDHASLAGADGRDR
jgi:hypothetical protein